MKHRTQQPVVGYISKAGRLAAYRLVARSKDGLRCKLQGFGAADGFWVDADKLCEPPAFKNSRKCDECDGWDGKHDITCAFG